MKTFPHLIRLAALTCMGVVTPLVAAEDGGSTPVKYVVCYHDTLSTGQGSVLKRYITSVMPGAIYINTGRAVDKDALVSSDVYLNYHGPNHQGDVETRFDRVLTASSDVEKFGRAHAASGSYSGGCEGFTTRAKAEHYFSEQSRLTGKSYPVETYNWDLSSDHFLEASPILSSEPELASPVKASPDASGVGILLASPDPVDRKAVEDKRKAEQANADKAALAKELQAESDARFDAQVQKDKAHAADLEADDPNHVKSSKQ